MAQFLVRDIPEHIAAAVKRRAKKNGRSTEAELRAIIAETIKPKDADFWEKADRLRMELEESGRTFSDSALLIREDRDSR